MTVTVRVRPLHGGELGRVGCCDPRPGLGDQRNTVLPSYSRSMFLDPWFILRICSPFLKFILQIIKLSYFIYDTEFYNINLTSDIAIRDRAS